MAVSTENGFLDLVNLMLTAVGVEDSPVVATLPQLTQGVFGKGGPHEKSVDPEDGEPEPVAPDVVATVVFTALIVVSAVTTQVKPDSPSPLPQEVAIDAAIRPDVRPFEKNPLAFGMRLTPAPDTPAAREQVPVHDQSGMFERSVEVRAATAADPTPSRAANVPPPSLAVVDALLASKSVRMATAAPETAARGPAVQEISMRIARPDSPAVDLHVVDRAGQVHVAVRTADAALQVSLRQDLGTLVNSLERSGYRTEVFAPKDAVMQTPLISDMSFQSGGRHGSESDPSRDDARSDPDGRRQQHPQQQQQQPPRQHRPANRKRTLENAA